MKDSLKINEQIERTRDQIRRAERAQRPVYYGQKGRALVHYYRACNCYLLAKRKGPPTVEELNAATNLYNRLIRYAIAAARQWERANTYERYANSQRCKDDEVKLDKRRDKLNQELKSYGLRLWNYGLYPSIVDGDGREEIRLYYFE